MSTEGELIVFAVVSVVIGPLSAIFPEAVATYSERWDARGIDLDGPVEPTDRRVTGTRYIGIGLTVLGIGMLIGLTAV